MDVSALIITKNEERNIAKCINSIKEVDHIYVFDDSSTDKTKEIAEGLGAKVITRNDTFDIPTKQDQLDFEKRFGWKPSFGTGPDDTPLSDSTFPPAYKIPPRDSGNLKKCFDKVKTDWVIGLSADEVVTWDLPRIKKEILPIADQVECDFIHSHNPDGSPTTITHRVYMFKRSMTKFVGRTHNTTTPNGRIVHCPFFRIDHWQTPNAIVDGKPIHSQRYVLPIMEYAVLKEDDQRSRFYLGREYYYYKRYDESIKLLNLYLAHATWMPEIAQARLYLARDYWESQQGDKAREQCLEAIKLNPDHKEALLLYSEMFFEPWKSKWKAIGDRATNQDILF